LSVKVVALLIFGAMMIVSPYTVNNYAGETVSKELSEANWNP
jgi:hypothetical protein